MVENIPLHILNVHLFRWQECTGLFGYQMSIVISENFVVISQSFFDQLISTNWLLILC